MTLEPVFSFVSCHWVKSCWIDSTKNLGHTIIIKIRLSCIEVSIGMVNISQETLGYDLNVTRIVVAWNWTIGVSDAEIVFSNIAKEIVWLPGTRVLAITNASNCTLRKSLYFFLLTLSYLVTTIQCWVGTRISTLNLDAIGTLRRISSTVDTIGTSCTDCIVTVLAWQRS